MRLVANLLDRISGAMNAVAFLFAIFAVLVMLGAACWQVFARYILSQPPAWTEELARFSMVWAGVLGASCAFRARVDPSLFPNMRDLKGRLGLILSLVAAVGTIAFVTPIIWYSVFGLNGQVASGYIARQMSRHAETLPISMGAFGVVIPLGFSLILLHALARITTRLIEPPSSGA